MTRATRPHLERHLDHLRAAPSDDGTLDLVVRRPAHGRREVLAEGVLDAELGMVGDNWLARATTRALATGRHLDAQLNVMGSRMIGLLAADDATRALAGDQLYLDLDLSHENLPAGARLALGDPAQGGAVIEVTSKPHTGCVKFIRHFGEEAAAFVNSDEGRRLRLRGFNARIVAPGVVRPGDAVRKLDDLLV